MNICVAVFYRICTYMILFQLVTVAFFSCVLFTGNYLNVQSKFFLTRSKNLILRILGIVIADVVLFFCVVAVVSMLESFVL